MIDKIYLRVNSDKVVKMLRTPPNLNRGEIAIELNIKVPKDVFFQPTYKLTLDVESPNTIVDLDLTEYENKIIDLKERRTDAQSKN